LAERGNYLLACVYYAGCGVKRSDEESSHWLKKAAEQGHGEAQKILKLRQDRKTNNKGD
jgi:TPR repeat protein